MIIEHIKISDNIYQMTIKNPEIARSAKPGQFLIVVPEKNAERIPLTVADIDGDNIIIVYMVVGKSTEKLRDTKEIYHIVGPLGQPSDIIEKTIDELKKEKFVFLAGGIGAAPCYLQIKYLYDRGIKPHVILAARDKSLLLWEEKLEKISHLHIATDNGSKGFHGLITDCLEEINKKENFTKIIAIGPMIMMKFASIKAQALNIPITVSLNPIMLDGTGMCGSCRCKVDGVTKFACVDGPEFDGTKVDYDSLLVRLRRDWT